MRQFGEFSVDFDAGELRRAGARVPVPDQALVVLRALLARPGAVITREELKEALWPGRVFLDHDLGLNKAVQRLRRALDDSSDSPKYIETLPRHGYRFIGTVADLPARPSAAEGRQPSSSHGGRWWSRLAAVVAVLLLTAQTIAFRSAPKTSSTLVTLAVTPFVAIGSPPSADDPLPLGLADTLISRLGAVQGMRVRPTRAVLGYLERPAQATAVGRELSVDYVLEGTVQRAGGRVRVATRLVRASDGQQVWSGHFDERAVDVILLQDAVAERVAGALSTRLVRTGAAPRGSRTSDVAAYHAYLRGRALYEQCTPESLRHAIQQFRRASTLDPSFALAYAGEIQTFGLLVTLGYAPVLEVLPHLQDAAATAVALGPDLAEVHVAAALVRSLEWNWAEEEAGYRRAIALNPSYVTAYHWYAFLIEGRGRLEEAIALRRTAFEIDPSNAGALSSLATVLADAGDLDAALAQSKAALELEPDFPIAHRGMGFVLLAQGRSAEAIAHLERSDDPGALAFALGRLGQASRARALLSELHRRSVSGYVSPLAIAAVHSGLGEADAAFEWLERAYVERTPWLMRLAVDPRFAPLRDDPRFQDLGRRIGLPADALRR